MSDLYDDYDGLTIDRVKKEIDLRERQHRLIATRHPAHLDRFWRNARVHTTHDPIRWRIEGDTLAATADGVVGTGIGGSGAVVGTGQPAALGEPGVRALRAAERELRGPEEALLERVEALIRP